MRSKQGSKGHLREVKNKKEIIKPRAAKSGHGNLQKVAVSIRRGCNHEALNRKTLVFWTQVVDYGRWSQMEDL